MSMLIMGEYMLLLEKFYTAGKNFYTATNSVNELNLNSFFFLNNELKFFTLPPTVPEVTDPVDFWSCPAPGKKLPRPSLHISLFCISSKADRMPKSPACWSG